MATRHPPLKRSMSDDYTDSHRHWNLEANTDKRSKDLIHQIDIHLQDNPSIFKIPALLFKVYVLAFFKKGEHDDSETDDAKELLETVIKEISIFSAELCTCSSTTENPCETCQGAIGFSIIANTLFGQIYELELDSSKAAKYFQEVKNLKKTENSASRGYIDGTKAFALSRLGPNKLVDSLHYFEKACSASQTNTDWLYGRALVNGRITRQIKGITEGTDKEIELYGSVLEQDANHILAKLFLALVLFNRSQTAEAEALFSEILADKANHKNREVLNRSIVFYREMSNFDKARELIGEAETLSEQDAFLFHQKACVDIEEYKKDGSGSLKKLLENAQESLEKATKLRESPVFVLDTIWVLQELGHQDKALKLCKRFAKKINNLSERDVIGFRTAYGKLLVKMHSETEENDDLVKGLDNIQQAIEMSLQNNDIHLAMKEHMDQELKDRLLKNLKEGILLYEECNLNRESTHKTKLDALQNLIWLKQNFQDIKVPFADDRSATDCLKVKSTYEHYYGKHPTSPELRVQEDLQKLSQSCGICSEDIWDPASIEKSLACVPQHAPTDILEEATPKRGLEEESSIDYSNLIFHEVIGEGGFGKVNRVTFKLPHQGFKEAAAKRVLDIREEEVNIMSRLEHPNIARMIGFCKHELAGIIILEYARNGSLHNYLKDNTKDLPLCLQHKWMTESALALQYLHNKDYLHRDIKANNCLLFEDNVLKLCDFGLARELPKDASSALSSQKGTPKYMAPELLRDTDAKYSKFSDIWAYGMLVYEIATRRMPFQEDDPRHVTFVVCMGTKLPPIPPKCPNHVSKLMETCWKMEPKERPTIDVILQHFLHEDEI